MSRAQTVNIVAGGPGDRGRWGGTSGRGSGADLVVLDSGGVGCRLLNDRRCSGGFLIS